MGLVQTQESADRKIRPSPAWARPTVPYDSNEQLKRAQLRYSSTFGSILLNIILGAFANVLFLGDDHTYDRYKRLGGFFRDFAAADHALGV